MNVSLIMFKENGQQKTFSIEPGRTVIGRKEECDLRIPLPEISRRHAVMLVEENTATLRDLGSANGTYLNNKRITEHELSPGDHIIIGPVVFTVQINGQPPDVRPVQTRLEARPHQAPAAAAAHASGPAAASGTGIAAADEEDPITALEAMATGDDTATLDMDGSSLGPGDSRI